MEYLSCISLHFRIHVILSVVHACVMMKIDRLLIDVLSQYSIWGVDVK